MMPFRSILHPTDFSPTSQHALGVAATLARDYGARLIVLHVLPRAVLVDGEGVVPPSPEEHRETCRKLLDEIRPPGGGVEILRQMIEGEDIPWEILCFAAEHECDAIVMGTHGRGASGRMVMGSVAEQVLHRAPCPVITIKTPAHAEFAGAALSVG